MGRPKGIWTPERVRQRIRVTKLMKRLQDHIDDPEKTPMKASQLKGTFFLLSRVVGTPNDPQDLNVNGNITVVIRDPTQRPAGYGRKPLTRD